MLVKFFHTLEDADAKPDAMCFYTEGVKAVCEDFPAVGSLQALEKADVRIVICQTCLDYYGLMDKVSVGQRCSFMMLIKSGFSMP